MASLSVTIRLPADLLEQIDAVAGVGKRTEWLIAAARAALAPRLATEAFEAAPRTIRPMSTPLSPLVPRVDAEVAARQQQVTPRFRDPKAGRL